MRQYVVQHRYRSGPFTWAAGDLVELDDATAAWVSNDSPGCIVPADAPAPVAVERAAEPERDRQARPGRNRGAR